jgi:hypothetical protein
MMLEVVAMTQTLRLGRSSQASFVPSPLVTLRLVKFNDAFLHFVFLMRGTMTLGPLAMRAWSCPPSFKDPSRGSFAISQPQ